MASDPFSYAKELVSQNPSWTALQVGTQVLVEFPTVPKAEMLGVLGYAGFATADAESAVEHLYGSSETIDVVARDNWQNTGVMVDAGQPTTVTYVSGQWTANPATGMVDAAGNPQYVAKPGYTLPGSQEGALIGWIGKPGAVEGEVVSAYSPFLIGNGATVPMGQSGFLFLCINDDLNQEYGMGLEDNEGVITVQITEQKATS